MQILCFKKDKQNQSLVNGCLGIETSQGLQHIFGVVVGDRIKETLFSLGKTIGKPIP